MAKDSYFYALGRRKSSTARVRLQGGKGAITINGKSAVDYFADSKYLLGKLQQPFVTLDLVDKFDVSAVVSGGGHDGQIEAVRLGIAKALTILNEEYKPTLKRADLLSRDSREKERKKFGLKGARKQRQFTKR
jgi:small subunit ribosomal protein S9